ncbi:MAG TPA: MBL fold metallo-hydrolase [SAR86 cluster bacterium]|jgi:glyoxylase-like metal-dependent hydrolase (beta-lactamase superfamily II)|nr:MBL fold metallo-hydrolase [SAR86 cluster bacterium]HJM15413.1 MBL fold metallo-hydrolase [SAR86 cluster bacterium]|tara:strand:- start:2619 stop:3293 length:675 start_codon:yes stop_codon:yes gene_type:complete
MNNDDLYLEQLLVGPMDNFIYLVGSKSTREVTIIDPAWDIDALLKHIKEKDLKLTSVLVTHYHPDHIGGGMGGHSIEGIAELLEKDPVKIFVHKLEAEGVKKVTGVSDTDLNIVESGDHLTIGENDIEFLHTPGHTPGSQCFKVNNNLVSGDTLFVQGCGRVDLPGSNSEDMFHSLQKLSALPNETILYPGHNYSAEPYESMEKVKEINTYLRIEDLDMWKQIM